MLDHACTFLRETGEDLEDLSRQEQLLAVRQFGEYLDRLDPTYKTAENFVPGCASATHMICTLKDDGTLLFEGDSESFISRGYIYILVEALNGSTLDELMNQVVPCVEEFAEKAQVRMSMVPSRANVFERLFRFMQRKAVEAAAKQQES